MKLNWDKSDGLIPAIIQNAIDGRVLMLGYMNPESLEQTRKTGRVTFYSRSRQSLWVKGETSGNFLRVEQILPDCDDDALLIRATPDGPTCHRGTVSCFEPGGSLAFLLQLEATIKKRIDGGDENSYILIDDEWIHFKKKLEDRLVADARGVKARGSKAVGHNEKAVVRTGRVFQRIVYLPNWRNDTMTDEQYRERKAQQEGKPAQRVQQ